MLKQIKKILRYAFLSHLVLFIAIQFYPYGRDHSNPPITAEPKWDSPQTRALFFRACVDCHSNQTVWPWYSHVAPISWLVQSDVDKGRSHLNVSEWGSKEYDEDEAAAQVRKGKMPLPKYLLLHPHAKLTDEEKQKFIRGLISTFGE